MKKLILLLFVFSFGITQAQQLLTQQFNAGSNETNLGIYVIAETFNQNYLLSNNTTLSESILMTVADENLGTEELEKMELQIYPNPVKDYLYLNSNEAFQIQLYDFTGKLIWQNSGNQMDISLFPNGIYIIKITSDSGKTFVKKIIIQH